MHRARLDGWPRAISEPHGSPGDANGSRECATDDRLRIVRRHADILLAHWASRPYGLARFEILIAKPIVRFGRLDLYRDFGSCRINHRAFPSDAVRRKPPFLRMRPHGRLVRCDIDAIDLVISHE